MRYTKYKWTPSDIASYFQLADLPHQRENDILCNLFQDHNDELIADYRNDFLKFRTKVRQCISYCELNDSEFMEIQKLMQEMTSQRPEKEDSDCLYSYFKVIKLFLLYSASSYRIKFRTLLKQCGYQRRSQILIENMNRAFSALGLQVFLKNRVPCNLSEIKLDRWITIRLKNQ